MNNIAPSLEKRKEMEKLKKNRFSLKRLVWELSLWHKTKRKAKIILQKMK